MLFLSLYEILEVLTKKSHMRKATAYADTLSLY